MNPRIEADGTTLGATVELDSAAVMGNAPANLKQLAKRPERLGFTVSSEVFGRHVPEYEDPAHLAAWLDGYFSGQAHLLEHTKTDVPAHEIMMRDW